METNNSLCDELSPCEVEGAVPEENTSESVVFPDFIKTESGVGITFYDRQKTFPARVRYGSIDSACIVKVPVVDPDPVLGKYMAQGCVEEKDGDMNQEIVVPVEFVTLPDGDNCAVLITNLSSYVRGFNNLSMQANATGKNLFGALQKLSNAIACLKDNGLSLSKWDGQQFYAYVPYGEFAVVLTPDILCDDAEITSSGETDKALASSLLYYLTGAFPVTGEGAPYATLIETGTASVIRFDSADRSVASDDDEAMVFWNALPEKLRDALSSCFFDLDTPCKDARQWAELFADLAETSESEPCVHCGKPVFSGVKECPCCKKDLDKRQLMSKWLVADETRSVRFGLTLPSNMVLDRTTVSPDLSKGKLMRMGYSAAKNILALQNISGESFTVDYGDLGTVEVKPKNFCVLKNGMKITVSPSGAVTISLLGFETKDSWEVEDDD